MANLLDYLAWRGDISFKVSPFNAIDSLILSQLSYIPYDGVVSSSFDDSMRMSEAAAKYSSVREKSGKPVMPLGSFINPLTEPLLFAAARSKRFAEVLLRGYVNTIDETEEKQFSAITFTLAEGSTYIAFRGTDDTIVGWKEDFNMAFMSPVPAQIAAVEYLNSAAGRIRGKLRVGGHSKGGNLAVYAAAKVPKKVKKRLLVIYNNDGPGFDQKFLASSGFNEIQPLIQAYIPQTSIVGMLLENGVEYTIVESSGNGIVQHDPFSWHLEATNFVTCQTISQKSIFIDRTLKAWLLQLDKAQRELFIDTLYAVLEATQAKTLSELAVNWVKNSGTIIKYLSQIDRDTRDAVLKSVQLLFVSAREQFPVIKNLLPAKTKRR